MGAVFSLPWTRLTPWPSALTTLAERGWEVVALTPRAAAEPLASVAAEPLARIALLLGSEGPGLSEAALSAVTRHVRIPMADGVDSLNVAAAVAVACYEFGAASRPPTGDK